MNKEKNSSNSPFKQIKGENKKYFILILFFSQPFCFFAISCISSSVLFLHCVERNLRTDFEIAPSAFLDFENISK